jgi:hypothetical protein
MLPSFLPQALAGRGAPLDARGCVLLVYVVTTLAAFYFKFIRKYLNISTAVGAFIECYP